MLPKSSQTNFTSGLRWVVLELPLQNQGFIVIIMANLYYEKYNSDGTKFFITKISEEHCTWPIYIVKNIIQMGPNFSSPKLVKNIAHVS